MRFAVVARFIVDASLRAMYERAYFFFSNGFENRQTNRRSVLLHFRSAEQIEIQSAGSVVTVPRGYPMEKSKESTVRFPLTFSAVHSHCIFDVYCLINFSEIYGLYCSLAPSSEKNQPACKTIGKLRIVRERDISAEIILCPS